MNGYTPLGAVQLNVNVSGKGPDGRRVSEGYFAAGACVHWGRRLVRLPITGEDGNPVLVPMENVVQMTEPEPVAEHKCDRCGERFANPGALATHQNSHKKRG